MSKIRLLSILAVACLLAPGACLGQITSWYKNYEGVISKYPITMHLYKTGHKYAGYYYYNSKEKLVYFAGDDSTLPGGKIRLSAFIGDKEVDESFTFYIPGRAIAGKWYPGKNKPLIFSATETHPTVGFDYIYTEGSASLRPAIKGSPAATFEAASIWPTGNSAQAVFLKKIITEEWDAKN